MSPLNSSNLEGFTLLLDVCDLSGVAISPDGDIQNLFNNDGKGAGRNALVQAIERGGRTLDCYDGYLPSLYAQFGFVEANRMKFNHNFAPPDWDYAKYGRPDVVFMSWKGYGPDGKAGALKRGRDSATWQKHEVSNDYTIDWDDAKQRSRKAAKP